MNCETSSAWRESRYENTLIQIIMLCFWSEAAKTSLIGETSREYTVNPFIHPCHPSIRYQINARTELAVRYNDISPLENHHCAVAFQILSLPECNIFANVDPEAFKQIRQVRRAFKLSLVYSWQESYLNSSQSCHIFTYLLEDCFWFYALNVSKCHANISGSFAVLFPGNYHPHPGHRHGQTRGDTRLL